MEELLENLGRIRKKEGALMRMYLNKELDEDTLKYNLDLLFCEKYEILEEYEYARLSTHKNRERIS